MARAEVVVVVTYVVSVTIRHAVVRVIVVVVGAAIEDGREQKPQRAAFLTPY